MSDRNITLDDTGFDDLPRTLRREREARERAAREPSPDLMGRDLPQKSYWSMPVEPAPVPALVRAIDVPFHGLVLFFLKAVVAAIPALILLTAILFAGGQVLKHAFPNLRHFEIEIRPVGSLLDPPPPPAAQRTAPAAPVRK
jgi:hypothetical protein